MVGGGGGTINSFNDLLESTNRGFGGQGGGDQGGFYTSKGERNKWND